MIQRIQTIYFFLASLLLATGFVLPAYIVTGVERGADPIIAGKTIFWITLADVDKIGLNVTLAFVVAIVLPLIAIGLYKNRRLQIRIGILAILVAAVAIALLVLAWLRLTLVKPPKEVNPSLGLFIPVGSIVFLILANRGVKKDEALVRSADRIR